MKKNEELKAMREMISYPYDEEKTSKLRNQKLN